MDADILDLFLRALGVPTPEDQPVSPGGMIVAVLVAPAFSRRVAVWFESRGEALDAELGVASMDTQELLQVAEALRKGTAPPLAPSARRAVAALSASQGRDLVGALQLDSLYALRHGTEFGFDGMAVSVIVSSASRGVHRSGAWGRDEPHARAARALLDPAVAHLGGHPWAAALFATALEQLNREA